VSAQQADLFETSLRAGRQPSEEIVAIVRAWLHAALALVKSAEAMPWAD